MTCINFVILISHAVTVVHLTFIKNTYFHGVKSKIEIAVYNKKNKNTIKIQHISRQFYQN